MTIKANGRSSLIPSGTGFSPKATRGAKGDRVGGACGEPPVPSGFVPAAWANTISPLNQVARTSVRWNGKQLSVMVGDRRAQGFAVLESYPDHPLKQMVILGQPSGNVGAGFWWKSDTIQALAPVKAPEVFEESGLRGYCLTVAGDAAGSVFLGLPVLDTLRAHRDVQFEAESRTEVRERASEAGICISKDAISARVTASSPDRVVYERSSISGAHRHRLEVQAQPGTTLSVNEQGELTAISEGKPSFTLSYSTNLPPLTPIAPMDFLRPEVRKALELDLERLTKGGLSRTSRQRVELVIRSLEDLSSMVFREKAIAGGWRFLTYFGRDTLQTIRMLRPLLDVQIYEDVLAAALERLSPEGAVAHEEDLADQAEFVRLQRALAGKEVPPIEEWSDPILDYKMVDDDFMLVSAIAEYLDDAEVDVDRKKAFLDRTLSGGTKVLDCIEKATAYVVDRATPYAESVLKGVGQDGLSAMTEEQVRGREEGPLSPEARREALRAASANADPKCLIRLPDGQDIGDWRDSFAGLAGGKYPSSVNLELVGTTLEKARSILRVVTELGEDSTLFGDVASQFAAEEASIPDKLLLMQTAWETARFHFEVKRSPEEVTEALHKFLFETCTASERAYFGSVELAPGVTTLDVALGRKIPDVIRDGWVFSAISLDEKGQPIPVMTSDGAFGLMGSSPRPEAVEEYIRLVTTPYPLGLGSKAGLLLTNAVLANDSELYQLMAPGRYHGVVVWPWLEALGVAALTQQAAVLPKNLDELKKSAMRAAGSVRNQGEGAGSCQTMELYGFEIEKRRGKGQPHTMVPIPFTGGVLENDECWPGNGVQLWATVLPLLIWAHEKKCLQS